MLRKKNHLWQLLFDRSIVCLSSAILAVLIWPVSVQAQAGVSVSPGEEVELIDVDGGGVNCRKGTVDGWDLFGDCVGGGFFGTNANPGANEVRARSNAGLSLLLFFTANGVPNYATAHIFKDILIEGGPPDTHVPVSISVVFDYRNFFFLGASHVASSSLSLHVIDLATGLPVASHTMFETERAGDQGFTDLALGDQRLVLVDSSSDLTVLLRRGREYRLVFELEVMSQVLAVGVVEADAFAEWKSITVRVDEDEVEQLTEHDAAVRSELALHDADVKSLLDEVLDNQAILRAGQLEIIRLLHTPQGRRKSDLGACGGSPCDFPD